MSTCDLTKHRNVYKKLHLTYGHVVGVGQRHGRRWIDGSLENGSITLKTQNYILQTSWILSLGVLKRTVQWVWAGVVSQIQETIWPGYKSVRKCLWKIELFKFSFYRYELHPADIDMVENMGRIFISMILSVTLSIAKYSYFQIIFSCFSYLMLN